MRKNQALMISDIFNSLEYLKKQSSGNSDNEIFVLQINGNIALEYKTDICNLYIASNPDAGIEKEDFTKLPLLKSGEWIKIGELRPKNADCTYLKSIETDNLICKHVMSKMSEVCGKVCSKIEEENQAKKDAYLNLIHNTKENWHKYLS
jgi:hypothetical protein